MPDHVMRHPWSTPGHPLKAHQAAPNHVRWGIWGLVNHCVESNLVVGRQGCSGRSLQPRVVETGLDESTARCSALLPYAASDSNAIML